MESKFTQNNMDRLTFTKSIIKEAESNIEIEEAMIQWWFHDSEDNKFRLTPTGFKDLKTLTACYTFTTQMPLNGYLLLQLRKMNAVYYIERHKNIMTVSIFSTKVATIINLYATLDNYLKTL